jgi:hypothetical protein
MEIFLAQSQRGKSRCISYSRSPKDDPRNGQTLIAANLGLRTNDQVTERKQEFIFLFYEEMDISCLCIIGVNLVRNQCERSLVFLNEKVEVIHGGIFRFSLDT